MDYGLWIKAEISACYYHYSTPPTWGAGAGMFMMFKRQVYSKLGGLVVTVTEQLGLGLAKSQLIKW